jgi:hypothetical protein
MTEVFVSIGEAFAAHTPSATPNGNTRGFVRANSRKASTTAFGGQWPACSIASTRTYANLYSNEIGLRWPQPDLACLRAVSPASTIP